MQRRSGLVLKLPRTLAGRRGEVTEHPLDLLVRHQEAVTVISSVLAMTERFARALIDCATEACPSGGSVKTLNEPQVTHRSFSEPRKRPEAALARRQSAPGRTRTCDPRLRRPSLYPAELRGLVMQIACETASVANRRPSELASRGFVQANGSSDQGDESLLVDLVVLFDVNGPPHFAVEARVEESGGIVQ
jgi:hypothetical protein